VFDCFNVFILSSKTSGWLSVSLSYWLRHRVNWYLTADDSEELAACPFRVSFSSS